MAALALTALPSSGGSDSGRGCLDLLPLGAALPALALHSARLLLHLLATSVTPPAPATLGGGAAAAGGRAGAPSRSPLALSHAALQLHSPPPGLFSVAPSPVASAAASHQGGAAGGAGGVPLAVVMQLLASFNRCLQLLVPPVLQAAWLPVTGGRVRVRCCSGRRRAAVAHIGWEAHVQRATVLHHAVLSVVPRG
jgi:hypothetical protein